MWPLISGATTTSPRSELFVTSDLLIQGDWKLIVGSASSASWPGPKYPNASSDGNTLDRYTAKCSPPGAALEKGGGIGPCLYNVGNGVGGDWTEHNNVAAANPAIVAKMYARLVELRKTEWSKPANASKAFDASCLDSKQVWDGKCVRSFAPRITAASHL